MAASLYIVVEGEDPGFDTFVNGHALARNEDALEQLAGSMHVAPLLQFFSADENSMCLLLDQGQGIRIGRFICRNPSGLILRMALRQFRR